jgi:hypothetical protein
MPDNRKATPPLPLHSHHNRRQGDRDAHLIRALPPDDLDAYEQLKARGFSYNFDDGWWYAERSASRIRYLLSAGYVTSRNH